MPSPRKSKGSPRLEPSAANGVPPPSGLREPTTAERLERLASQPATPAEPEVETLPDPPDKATVDNVFEYVAKLAFFDPRRITAPSGKLRELRDLDLTTAAALTGIDVDQNGNVKYRFGSRLPALSLLTQLLKMLDQSSGDVKNLDALLTVFRERYQQMEKQLNG